MEKEDGVPPPGYGGPAGVPRQVCTTVFIPARTDRFMVYPTFVLMESTLY